MEEDSGSDDYSDFEDVRDPDLPVKIFAISNHQKSRVCRVLRFDSILHAITIMYDVNSKTDQLTTSIQKTDFDSVSPQTPHQNYGRRQW
jgi:hypothetical protein